jgi:hypothetical protein
VLLDLSTLPPTRHSSGRRLATLAKRHHAAVTEQATPLTQKPPKAGKPNPKMRETVQTGERTPSTSKSNRSAGYLRTLHLSEKRPQRSSQSNCMIAEAIPQKLSIDLTRSTQYFRDFALNMFQTYHKDESSLKLILNLGLSQSSKSLKTQIAPRMRDARFTQKYYSRESFRSYVTSEFL